jgi:hypothetical protein
MKCNNPPLGVEPYWVWVAFFPDPTLENLTRRYQAVMDAVDRARAAGWEPLEEWLIELGVS